MSALIGGFVIPFEPIVPQPLCHCARSPLVPKSLRLIFPNLKNITINNIDYKNNTKIDTIESILVLREVHNLKRERVQFPQNTEIAPFSLITFT